MAYITDVVKTIERESVVENQSTALASIAARAAEYTLVLRKNQLSKLCMVVGDETPETNPVIRKGTYIVC